jgi:hypothetical protein
VETALALLVAAIGLTAVMALIPTAMDQGKRMMDETYAAFLAEAAFASYRAVAESDRLTWDEVKSYEAIAPVTITGGQDVFWKDSNDLKLIADGNIYTQIFIAASVEGKWAAGPWPLPASWEQYDHALRYRMTWVEISERLRGLSLEVWPGEYGTTNNPYVFYTEIFNHGF